MRSVRLLQLAALFGSSLAVSGQSLDKPLPPTDPHPSTRAVSEWQARKFGMFIHFGVYSELGGVWKGRKISYGYSEQIQSHAPIAMADYEQVARQFNPRDFNAEQIVQLAEAAGMKFIVITSKHHDGFSMFHTKLSNYNVVDYTLYGKDIVKQLSDACARHHMKFGVYYSSIDWHFPGNWKFPGGAVWEDNNDNPIPKAHEDFNVGQLKELTSNYGPLSEIWFDMGKPTPAQSKRFADTVHKAQPDCMVSGRVFNSMGDFTVMGDNRLPDFVIDEPWQTPASIYTDTWGYRSWAQRDDLQGKINEHILNLVRVTTRGGNYILNIGPRGDGSVVPFEADVLKGVGKWLATNREAIYGTEAQPFKKLSFGYASVKGNRLFLFVQKLPANKTLELPGLTTKMQKAYLLSGPAGTRVSVHNGPSPSITVSGVSTMPEPLAVVAVELAGPVKVTPGSIAPGPDGRLVLSAKDANRFLNYNGYGYSERPSVYKQQWWIHLPKPAKYRLQIVYGKPQATGEMQLSFGTAAATVLLDGRSASGSSVNLTSDCNPCLVEVTPPRPFHKGAKLSAPIEQLELIPE